MKKKTGILKSSTNSLHAKMRARRGAAMLILALALAKIHPEIIYNQGGSGNDILEESKHFLNQMLAQIQTDDPDNIINDFYNGNRDVVVRFDSAELWIRGESGYAAHDWRYTGKRMVVLKDFPGFAEQLAINTKLSDQDIQQEYKNYLALIFAHEIQHIDSSYKMPFFDDSRNIMPRSIERVFPIEQQCVLMAIEEAAAFWKSLNEYEKIYGENGTDGLYNKALEIKRNMRGMPAGAMANDMDFERMAEAEFLKSFLSGSHYIAGKIIAFGSTNHFNGSAFIIPAYRNPQYIKYSDNFGNIAAKKIIACYGHELPIDIGECADIVRNRGNLKFAKLYEKLQENERKFSEIQKFADAKPDWIESQDRPEWLKARAVFYDALSDREIELLDKYAENDPPSQRRNNMDR